jgi:hypothetical protein
MLSLAFAFALFGTTVTSQLQPVRCDLPDCLKRISALVSVDVVAPTAKELYGTWSFGGGLGGSFLYLFDDETYMFTRWSDIMPETVYDKGGWQVAGSVLVLTHDPDVVWEDKPADRRFLVYRTGSAAVRFLGLDFMLSVFERVTREVPGDHLAALKAASYNRTSRWRPGEAKRRKAELMEKCWNPEFFAGGR